MPLRDIPKQARFSELPFDHFNTLKIAVYVVDLEWNYLFVNHFVSESLGERGLHLEGKNLWEQFPELASDPSYAQIKNEMESGKDIQLTTTSPIHNQKLSITGYVLHDCYIFSTVVIPKKEDLINELRKELRRKSAQVL